MYTVYYSFLIWNIMYGRDRESNSTCFRSSVEEQDVWKRFWKHRTIDSLEPHCICWNFVYRTIWLKTLRGVESRKPWIHRWLGDLMFISYLYTSLHLCNVHLECWDQRKLRTQWKIMLIGLDVKDCDGSFSTVGIRSGIKRYGSDPFQEVKKKPFMETGKQCSVLQL